jgi:magnesium-protoporphyrin O-methyltransferase
MNQLSYQERRSEIESYFDRTAVKAWTALTSNAPVGRIRATVRAGRDEMRKTILSWLPADLTGRRILDAGCGTGALALEVAQRGAEVVAIDLSANLIALAEERCRDSFASQRIHFACGDMSNPIFGEFDYVIAMDSLIHYSTEDAVKVITALAPRTRTSVIFTFAPRTRALAAMHCAGRLFPRNNRAPSIVPVAEDQLRKALKQKLEPYKILINKTQRISRGFYTSQAMELAWQ